jgi:hypothetical protein
MELETFIQARLASEKNRFERNPAAAERAKVWIATIEKAPRSFDAIQSIMDAKEVAMNKTSDIVELQQLDREWSALLWLQSVIKQTHDGKVLET